MSWLWGRTWKDCTKCRTKIWINSTSLKYFTTSARITCLYSSIRCSRQQSCEVKHSSQGNTAEYVSIQHACLWKNTQDLIERYSKRDILQKHVFRGETKYTTLFHDDLSPVQEWPFPILLRTATFLVQRDTSDRIRWQRQNFCDRGLRDNCVSRSTAPETKLVV